MQRDCEYCKVIIKQEEFDDLIPVKHESSTKRESKENSNLSELRGEIIGKSLSHIYDTHLKETSDETLVIENKNVLIHKYLLN